MMRIPADITRAILPGLGSFPHQQFWQAPYGLIWYLVNKPIGIMSRGSPIGYIFWTWAVTIALIYFVPFQSGLFLLSFSGIALFHLFKAAWNVSILWLCLLGFVHPYLLAVPILAKLPVGNPAPFRQTWNHVLHAIPYKNSWFYYLTIAIIWVMVAIRI